MIGLLSYGYTPASQELSIWKTHKADRKKQLKKLRSVSKAFRKSDLRRFDEIIADCERQIRAEESGRIQAEMLQRAHLEAMRSPNVYAQTAPSPLSKFFGF